jgi:hypothetical protein
MKAALLSGLVFPGLGHMILKYYLRGSVLVLGSVLALAVLVTVIVQRALGVLDQINAGTIAPDAESIAASVSASAAAGGSLIEQTALIVLGCCWLIGIVDAYRLGAMPKNGPAPVKDSAA